MTDPYVDPQTIHNPNVSAVPPASWGDTVRGDLEFLIAPPSVCAERTSNQSIPDSTPTAVQFNASDRWDTDAFHDTSTNNSRLVVPTGLAGRYEVRAFVQFATNTTGGRVAYIYKNGSLTRWENDSHPGSGNRINTVGEVELGVTDYIELMVYQSSGGSLNLGRALLSMRWVSR